MLRARWLGLSEGLIARYRTIGIWVFVLSPSAALERNSGLARRMRRVAHSSSSAAWPRAFWAGGKLVHKSRPRAAQSYSQSAAGRGGEGSPRRLWI